MSLKNNKLFSNKEKLNKNQHNIIVKNNNTFTKCICAICNKWMRADYFKQPFIDGDFGLPVCDDCFQLYDNEQYELWLSKNPNEIDFEEI